MASSSVEFRSLVHSSMFVERVLSDASDAIIASDVSQEILLFNKAAEDMFGYKSGEVVGRELEVLLPLHAHGAHRGHVEGFLRDDVDRRAMGERRELTGRHKDGTEFPVEVTISKVKISGRVVLSAIVRDVSERRRLEEQRERAGARFSALFQHATDAILVVDEWSVVMFATPSFTTMLGYEVDEVLGSKADVIIHPDDVQTYEQLIGYIAAVPGRSAPYQLRAQHRDGNYRYIESKMTNLLDEASVAGLVINARDVTERKKAEVVLAHQAFHDDLTGLPNRALLTDRIQPHARHCRVPR